MLTVITPATSHRLTTLERARALLGFGSGDDAAVNVLVDQASRAVADYCRRPFGLETVRESFGALDRQRAVMLARSPVTAIASVTRDGVALLSSEYLFDAEKGLLYPTDSYEFSWWHPWLVVDYTAGYLLPSDAEGTPTPTLPEPVERAAILLVGACLSARSRDPLLKSQDISGVMSAAWWMPGAGDNLLSPEAERQRLLRPYRRIYP